MDTRYDHKSAEAQAQALWQEQNTYSPAHNSGPLFSIDTPPPTVSGSLHIGHIFSYTQTDIIARYKRMQGFSVLYPFGFDDNGLPTERFVEKTAKVSGHRMPRSEFIALCLQETHKAEEVFKSLWQRMGLSANWEHCYSTISDSVRRLSQASFLDLYKKGFVYRKDEPALYCTTCFTSVAQAELDDAQVSSYFNDIIFKDQQGNDLIIGTTRPELLPSCVALLFNPTDSRYQHLRGTRATVPLFGFDVPVLEDEKVLPDKGTGLVMCCTFGDTTDIEWYKKFKLPFKRSIGLNGIFGEHAGILSGLKVPAARETVLKALKDAGLLVHQKQITHAVSIHERCKKEIEYTVLPQWFVRIIEHKEAFLKLADDIQWSPAFMKSRYINWVENLGWDWCISRQRFYGIPFPVWHCFDCNAILMANESQLPLDPQETIYGKPCPECASTNIIPDTDVMDTWNTSALTPYIIAEMFASKKVTFNENGSSAASFLPMSMRPQAHDIIRTWAFYSITRAWMHDKTIPWTDVVISGHVTSSEKEKLSKSVGNAKLTPEALLEQYPADAIRYWTASSGLGQDTAFSDTQLKIGQKLLTKLWNAFRFVSMHFDSVDHTQMPTLLGTVNEWLIHEVLQCFESYTYYFNKNEFSLALDQIERFFWHTYCDNYLEIIKDQLFNPDAYDTQEITATKWTLYTVGLNILRLYAPFIPHITETIYQTLYAQHVGVPSLHQTRCEKIYPERGYAQSAERMKFVLEIIATVRKLKSEHNLSLKTELTQLLVVTDTQEIIGWLQPHTPLLRGITRAQGITYEVGNLDKPELIKNIKASTMDTIEGMLAQTGDIDVESLEPANVEEWYAKVKV